MIQIMTCSGCRKSGTFEVSVSYTVDPDVCRTCRHDQARAWHFNFCTMICFLRWTQRIVATGGVPCEDCVGLIVETRETGPTGFRFGHAFNGICPTCKGTKKVEVRKS